MFLFDTDILSHTIKRNPPSVLLDRLAKTSKEQQFTTTITVGEMVYGAFKSPRTDHFLKKLNEQLWPNVRILSFDSESANIYGRLRANLEKRGETIGEPDLRIASIALSSDLTLITANIKHFRRISGLKIENWLIS